MSTYLRLGDFNVPGYGLQVNGNLEIRTEELSGETSGSDQVSKSVLPSPLKSPGKTLCHFVGNPE